MPAQTSGAKHAGPFVGIERTGSVPLGPICLARVSLGDKRVCNVSGPVHPLGTRGGALSAIPSLIGVEQWSPVKEDHDYA
jgi:hypothetical protein